MTTIRWISGTSIHAPTTAEINAGAYFRPPWEYPDRNPMPTFVPFPQVARLEALRSCLNRHWERLRYVHANWERIDEEPDW